MTNDLKLVPAGPLTRFCRQQYPALGWRAGRAASRPHGGHSILLLFLPSSSSSFSSPPSLLCSLLTVAATVPERPRPAPEDKRRQQMEKPPKLLISLANLGTASFPGLSPSFSFNHLSTLTLFIQNCFQKAKASLAKKMKVV